LTKLGLRLHPGKTRIVDIRRGAEGFDFLGFHHRMVESRKRRGPTLSAPRRTRPIAALCQELTATKTIYPGTDLILVYSVKEPG